LVVSLGSLRMAEATWYMGVMPVPPAIMPGERKGKRAEGNYRRVN
jgi:hypothetical protein